MREVNECLYCSRTDAKFTSAEHVLPESLGNTDLVLPKGTVCDKCNNGILAQLDNTLLEFEIIKFLRVYLRIPNKAGKYPVGKFGNMKLKVTPTGMHIDIDKMTKKHFESEPVQPDHSVKFKLIMRGKKDTVAWRKKFARSLYKIGLGALCLYDRDFAYSSRFDEAREIILGKKDFSGYFIWQSNPPTPNGHITHQLLKSPQGDDIVIFQVNLFGAEFIFDFEKRKIVGKRATPPPNIHIFEWSL